MASSRRCRERGAVSRPSPIAAVTSGGTERCASVPISSVHQSGQSAAGPRRPTLLASLGHEVSVVTKRVRTVVRAERADERLLATSAWPTDRINVCGTIRQAGGVVRLGGAQKAAKAALCGGYRLTGALWLAEEGILSTASPTRCGRLTLARAADLFIAHTKGALGDRRSCGAPWAAKLRGSTARIC